MVNVCLGLAACDHGPRLKGVQAHTKQTSWHLACLKAVFEFRAIDGTKKFNVGVVRQIRVLAAMGRRRQRVAYGVALNVKPMQCHTEGLELQTVR